ncbi:hypothetical protein [Demequina capsici]|uniref:Uncharacterized protein n=1 Tax=Demequina capsici TaxID=3075620 RepID=A0AA96JE32_9MICO|nr:hypothetical protein [Demequina sp. OYTSA14]WNM25244.1 hypothetical protein RN606_03595 [Demequina sp. OYTSA14]
MARKGIEIPVASDTRDFEKGIKSGVITPLEDAADSLKDVERAGDRAGEQLEQSMRDAQRRTEDLADEHKALQDVIEKGSRTSYRKMSDESEKATRSASDDVDEFKDEARSNFSEVASSFSGDMDSAVDLVQGTLGGLAGSLSGPVGLALGGLGAAAGLFYTQWKDQTEKVQQRVSDMTDDMIQSGERYLSANYIQQGILDIIQGADDAVVSLDQVNKIVDATGAPKETVLRAAAGDAEALNELMPVLQGNLDDANGKLADYSNKVGGDGARTEELRTEVGYWQSMVDVLDGVQNGIDKANETAQTYNATVASYEAAHSLQGQAEKFDILNGKIGEVGAGIRNLPKVGIDTSQAERDISRFVSKQRHLTIQADVVSRPGVTIR